MAQDFPYYRYKCMICRDYDACGQCFENRKVSKSHKMTHPMLPLPFPTNDEFLSKMIKLIDNNTI